MLLNLPPELIIIIGKHLKFCDKLNLTKTCRKLNTLITENNLYDQVTLDYSKAKNDFIIQKFKTGKCNASQVKELSINLDELDNGTYIELSTIFSNLTNLINLSYTERERPIQVKLSLLEWAKTLERYSNDNHTYQLLDLMETSTFSRITDMDISPCLSNGIRYIRTTKNIVDCIVNAPRLKNLRIYHCDMTIGALEKIHSRCKSLKSIKLDRVCIIAIEGTLPSPISPADSVLHFMLNPESVLCDTTCKFLKYILQKYPNLVDMAFMADNDKSSLTSMLYYTTPLHEQSRDFKASMDQLVASIPGTVYAYQHDGPSLLLRLPRTLKSFRTYSETFNGVIGTLINANFQCKSLNIVKQHQTVSTYPDIFRLLQKSDALNSLDIVLTASIQSYGQTVASNSLTTLKLGIDGESKHSTLDIGWLLSAFPSLGSLEIDYSDPVLVINETGHVNPNLRKLKVQDSLTSTDFLKYLSVIAPNLKVLQWHLFGRSDYYRLNSKHKIRYDAQYLPQPSGNRYTIDISNFHLDSFYLNCSIAGKSPFSDIKRACFGVSTHEFAKFFVVQGSEDWFSLTEHKNVNTLHNFMIVLIRCEEVKTVTINNIHLSKNNDGLQIFL